MDDNKEKEFFPCILDQKDCAACYNGICIALEAADFKGSGCPFYKSAKQQAEESVDAIKHLMNIGRFDLIKKYHAKVAKKYGC